jgi:hypothetical protein
MIDRSKFKKTSASQLSQSDKELNKTLGKKEKSGNGHTIDEGQNLFRFYPSHPECGEMFVVPFVQTFLPAMVKEKDKDNKEIMVNGSPKMKLSVRPVWNTKVHGEMKKDLVEEYINLSRLQAKKLSENEAKEYLKPIYGAYSKDASKNIQGINYPTMWIVYADKYPGGNSSATPVFDELRIKKSIKERLNKIAAMETANDPLGTDPFTDLDEGKAVKILYDKDAENPQSYYTTELDNSTVNEIINGKTYKLPKTYPISDEQLERFMKAEPLVIKYGKKLATRKNFEAQLVGLQLLDDKYKMRIFELPEWEEIITEIDGYYPENDAPENTNDAAADQTDDIAEVDDNSDEFDLMDRKELQAFARSNKTGILVKPSMSDDDIRNLIREWQKNSVINSEPLPGEDGYDENKVVTATSVKIVEVPKETKEERQAFVDELSNAGKEEIKEAPVVAVSAKDKLAALRNKVKATA